MNNLVAVSFLVSVILVVVHSQETCGRRNPVTCTGASQCCKEIGRWGACLAKAREGDRCRTDNRCPWTCAEGLQCVTRNGRGRRGYCSRSTSSSTSTSTTTSTTPATVQPDSSSAPTETVTSGN